MRDYIDDPLPHPRICRVLHPKVENQVRNNASGGGMDEAMEGKQHLSIVGWQHCDLIRAR